MTIITAKIARITALICVMAQPLWAEPLVLDGAPELVFDQSTEDQVLALPIAALDQTGVPSVQWVGTQVDRVYHSPITKPPSAIMADISMQLQDRGYDVILACVDRSCGGFGFRFKVPIVAAPHMYVDLGNYAFVSATLDNKTALFAMISQTQQTTHIQLSEISKSAPATVEIQTPVTLSLAQNLDQDGVHILGDLEFTSGSSALAQGSYTSLQALARYLADHPNATIALVGHTDAQGTLAANVGLSESRAKAVRDLLAEQFGIAPARMTAHGVGYLAPVTTNATQEGRAENRRVEVVLVNRD